MFIALIRSSFLFLFLSIFLSESTFAKAILSCSEQFLRFSQIKNESSVELEMKMSKNLLSIFTTEDGTLAPVLHVLETPDWLKEWKNKFYPHIVDAKNLDWDMLDIQQKYTLLKYVSEKKTNSFFDNRNIMGIKIKKIIPMYFPEETAFLGKKYSPGTHQIDVSSVLGGKVEYMGPDSVKNVSGVELHFRSHDHTGSAVKDAWTFQKAIGDDQTHLHVHLLATIPK